MAKIFKAAKIFRFAIAFIFFFVADHASAFQISVKPQSPGQTSVKELHVLQAQFRIEFGVSDSIILGSLSSQGYSDIRITKKKLTKARAEACKGGIRYDVEVAFDGRIRRANEIGKCRSVINHEIARDILRQKGFRNIQLSPEGAGFVAAACRGKRRFRVYLDQFGDIQREKVLGRCGGILTEYDIAALLRAQGYSRVRTKREPNGRFSVKACRRDDKVTLLVRKDGVIIREHRAGRCDPPIHPATIPALLARYGFSRIDIIDRQLPRYVAHACRDTQRLEISMNRFGEIVDERKIGYCVLPFSAADLKFKLRNNGYARIQIIEDRANGFVAEVCEGGSKLRLELTRYGETISQYQIGDCPSRRVKKILRQFEQNGMTGAKIFVEGCRNRKKLRIQLDEFGIAAGRKVIGRCR